MAALVTERRDGDLRPSAADEARRRAIFDVPWFHVRQVHGAEVVLAGGRRGAEPGTEADGIVTAEDELALALFGADCALVAMASPEGIRGAAHAGWKGVSSGVIEHTAAAMRRLGASEIEAWTSPMIHPECYPFSPGDLEPLAAHFGPEVIGSSSAGVPAFDLPRAVAIALERGGARHLGSLGGCTSCDERFYSWRRGRDEARHALVVVAAATVATAAAEPAR